MSLYVTALLNELKLINLAAVCAQCSTHAGSEPEGKAW